MRRRRRGYLKEIDAAGSQSALKMRMGERDHSTCGSDLDFQASVPYKLGLRLAVGRAPEPWKRCGA